MNIMRSAGDRLGRSGRWIDDIDPGGRRRVRGLRLAASFAMASMAGTLAMPAPAAWRPAPARGAAFGMAFSALVLPVRLRNQLAEMLAAALTYTGRKIIRTLADIAAELDRRDGAAAQPVAR